MENIEYTAKNLYFLGKEFESNAGSKFKEMADNVFKGPGYQKLFQESPNLKYEFIGQILMDKMIAKKNKEGEKNHNAKLPIAQTIVRRILMQKVVNTMDREAFLRVMRELELKDEDVADKKEHDQFIEQLKNVGILEEDSFLDLSRTDFDTETDYDYNAFSLVATKFIDELPEEDNRKEDDLDAGLN